MPRRAKAKRAKSVETLTHEKARRANLPSVEQELLMKDEEQTSIRLAYERRNRDLDPQLVWRGKDAQDRLDLVVNAPPLHPAVHSFSGGFGGKRPTVAVIEAASRIAAAALDKTVEPEITVDVDGALSFDLRLANGLLVFAELDIGGSIDASIYDDREGILIKRLPKATESELIGWF